MPIAAYAGKKSFNLMVYLVKINVKFRALLKFQLILSRLTSPFASLASSITIWYGEGHTPNVVKSTLLIRRGKRSWFLWVSYLWRVIGSRSFKSR